MQPEIDWRDTVGWIKRRSCARGRLFKAGTKIRAWAVVQLPGANAIALPGLVDSVGAKPQFVPRVRDRGTFLREQALEIAADFTPQIHTGPQRSCKTGGYQGSRSLQVNNLQQFLGSKIRKGLYRGFLFMPLFCSL